MNSLREKNTKAANRLHHLSMRYVGALLEACTGKPVGLIGQSHPGLHDCRSLIDLILLTRAEINAQSAILVRKGVCTVEELSKEITEQYEWLTDQKAQELGVEVTDYGLVFKSGS